MKMDSYRRQNMSADFKVWQYFVSIFLCLSVTVLLCDSEGSTLSDVDLPVQIDPSSTTIQNPTGQTSAPSLANEHLDFESVQNDQLCPDMTTETTTENDVLIGKYPSRTIIVNLPKKRGHDMPCNFKVKGSNNKMTNVGIRGFHLSSAPWTWESSDSCSSFIKFRITEPPMEEELKSPEIICRIWKLSKSIEQPKLIHPIMWNYPNKKIGISFLSASNVTNFNLSNVISWIYLNSAKGNTPEKLFLSDQKYLQIVFTVSSGLMCSLRVQQYFLDQNREGCNATMVPSNFKFCGCYRCSDQIHLMNQLGSWTYMNWGLNNEFEEPRGSVLRSHLSESGYYRRRRTYWPTAMIRSSIIPVLFFGMVFLGYKFFCVLYPNYPVLPERRARNQAAINSIRAFNDVPIDASNLRDRFDNLGPRGYTRSSTMSTSVESRINCHHDIRIDTPIPDPPPPEYDFPPSYSEATKV